MMSHDSVAKALPVPWFFCLKRWDTHCGETDEINRLRKTKAFQSLLTRERSTWTRDTPQTRFTLCGFAGCRLVSLNGRNVAMKLFWLYTWAEDEIMWTNTHCMDFVESCYTHGLDVPALKIRVKWGLSVTWKYLQKLGKTWNMVRNLPAQLTLEKKFRFFLPVHIASYCGIPTL